MMLSFLRANSRGCFDENNPLPVSLKVLEIYTQILLSLHKFSLIVQRSTCCIGHVLPLIWNIVHGNLERFRLNDEPKELRDLLIAAIKKKFNYELRSEVYLVATFLNVETYKTWILRSFGRDFFKKGLDALSDVAMRLLSQNQGSNETAANNDDSSDSDSLFNFEISK